MRAGPVLMCHAQQPEGPSHHPARPAPTLMADRLLSPTESHTTPSKSSCSNMMGVEGGEETGWPATQV